MRHVAGVALLAAATAAVGALPAQAAPPSRVTIVAVFDPIRYGENAYVNGQLISDEDQSGQIVALEQADYPFTTWTAVAQTTTDYAGYYSFKLHPAATTQYRSVNQGVTSDRQVTVRVAPRISLKVVPAGRHKLRYSGTFAPAVAGQSVALERRSRSGAWTTIATPALHGGSAFGGRIQASTPTTLRAFFASDGAHLDAFSSAVHALPGGVRQSGGAAARAAGAGCAAPVITHLAFKPTTPVAGRGATLRVQTSLPGGRIQSVDVLWGEGGTRDHFTLAPALRRSSYAFTLRHRYKKPGRYRLTVRTYGYTGDCKRGSRAARPLVRVLSA